MQKCCHAPTLPAPAAPVKDGSMASGLAVAQLKATLDAVQPALQAIDFAVLASLAHVENWRRDLR
jgi:hypothetical protein